MLNIGIDNPLVKMTLPTNYELFFHFLESEYSKVNNIKILDYGCGNGLVVQAGRQRGYEIFGVDNFYGNNVNVMTLPPYIQLLGTKMRIPYPADFFDVCISNQVVEHIKDLEIAVSEIARVLKKGGIMLHVFPTYECIIEGHNGIPFIHRFKKGSPLRYFYALTARSFGLGYNRDEKAVTDWVADSLVWLDNFVFYRKWSDIKKAFSKHFRIELFTHQQLAFHLEPKTDHFARILKKMLHYKTFANLLYQIQWMRLGRAIICKKNNLNFSVQNQTGWIC